MNIIIYLVVAAIIGWVATEITHNRSKSADQHHSGSRGSIPGRLLPQPPVPYWDDQRCDYPVNHAVDTRGCCHPAGDR